MGFIKTASAKIFKGHENISIFDWLKCTGNSFNNRTARKIIKNYSPDDYLLTHCTIIASVNVDPRVPHYITPDTEQFVNNNQDSWESELLATPKIYQSFVGAHNFLEHLQVTSLSKGRVISAALREVPVDNSKETVYFVDILVATDRKHTGLINKISSGQLNTLSMGCHVAYTYCSKCGHKAFEEEELCSCIKYAKGSHFYDEFGTKRIIAELCGHKDDEDSVRFIEASWVAVPAFAGAVMRNVVSFQETEEGKVAKSKISSLLEKAHKRNIEEEKVAFLSKAASQKIASQKISTEKSDWISNKIRILIDEGYDQDQAAAIAYNMWDKKKEAKLSPKLRKLADFMREESKLSIKLKKIANSLMAEKQSFIKNWLLNMLKKRFQGTKEELDKLMEGFEELKQPLKEIDEGLGKKIEEIEQERQTNQ